VYRAVGGAKWTLETGGGLVYILSRTRSRGGTMSAEKRPPKIQRPPEKGNLDPVAVRKAVRAVFAMRQAEGRPKQTRRR
jgi:hypothetical protein